MESLNQQISNLSIDQIEKSRMNSPVAKIRFSEYYKSKDKCLDVINLSTDQINRPRIKTPEANIIYIFEGIKYFYIDNHTKAKDKAIFRSIKMETRMSKQMLKRLIGQKFNSRHWCRTCIHNIVSKDSRLLFEYLHNHEFSYYFAMCVDCYHKMMNLNN
jgi:hypothetical protein